MAKTRAPRGRPPVASRDLLQEAAFELFLEQGYEKTTVADIARRAGVGRSTFFNHFTAKSDVFWTELDDAATTLESRLSGSDAPGLESVRRAILSVGEAFGPDRVPFVLTQYELIGSVGELQATAFARLVHHARLIGHHLTASGLRSELARAVSFALVAACVAAAGSWAAAGTSRGPLTPYLSRVIDPILAGFSA